jgi:thiol-disulfide isomerase/thioredoxin
MAAVMGMIAIAPIGGTNLFTRFSFGQAAHGIVGFSQATGAISTVSAQESQFALTDKGPMPSLAGAIGWLNSSPLTYPSLRGKVVLINFWTYTCINSLRPLPYVKSWAAKYKGQGLVVIGVHTPEFSFERETTNVERAVRALTVIFPVAVDSNYKIWDAFHNAYWPAQFFIDGHGRIRYHHVGEGDYGALERVIQELLRENGATGVETGLVSISPTGVEAAPGEDEGSPETFLGYDRTERFASPGGLVHDSGKTYSLPANPSLNQWGLGGSWTAGREGVVLQAAPGKILFRFHSRDLHLVVGPTQDGKPVRFRVTLDGAPPGDNHGSDAGPDGAGEVRAPRLYQLIRQKGQIKDRTFEIEFLDPGVQAFDFTFG